jgi:hypothetical protein
MKKTLCKFLSLLLVSEGIIATIARKQTFESWDVNDCDDNVFESDSVYNIPIRDERSSKMRRVDHVPDFLMPKKEGSVDQRDRGVNSKLKRRWPNSLGAKRNEEITMKLDNAINIDMDAKEDMEMWPDNSVRLLRKRTTRSRRDRDDVNDGNNFVQQEFSRSDDDSSGDSFTKPVSTTRIQRMGGSRFRRDRDDGDDNRANEDDTRMHRDDDLLEDNVRRSDRNPHSTPKKISKSRDDRNRNDDSFAAADHLLDDSEIQSPTSSRKREDRNSDDHIIDDAFMEDSHIRILTNGKKRDERSEPFPSNKNRRMVGEDLIVEAVDRIRENTQEVGDKDTDENSENRVETVGNLNVNDEQQNSVLDQDDVKEETKNDEVDDNGQANAITDFMLRFPEEIGDKRIRENSLEDTSNAETEIDRSSSQGHKVKTGEDTISQGQEETSKNDDEVNLSRVLQNRFKRNHPDGMVRAVDMIRGNLNVNDEQQDSVSDQGDVQEETSNVVIQDGSPSSDNTKANSQQDELNNVGQTTESSQSQQDSTNSQNDEQQDSVSDQGDVQEETSNVVIQDGSPSSDNSKAKSQQDELNNVGQTTQNSQSQQDSTKSQ